MNINKKITVKIVIKIIILVIVAIIMLPVLFFGLFFGVLYIVSLSYPEDYETIDQVMPNEEVYGNSAMNLVSNNCGEICQWRDKILISTNSGVIAVSSDLNNYTDILDTKASYLNIVDDIMYYEEDPYIYMYNLKTNESSKIFGQRMYSICSTRIIGDKIYYFKFKDDGFVGCIDLQTNKHSMLINTKYDVERIAGYRNGIFYYTDSSKLYAYNILESTNNEVPIKVDGNIQSAFIKENCLFVVYKGSSSHSKLIIYDLDSYVQNDIKLVSENSKRVNNVVILNDTIVYEDGYSLYFYDINSERLLKDLKEIKEDGRYCCL